jgi:hypothetical protein
MAIRLASFSIGSTGNGADAADIVTVEVSPNGGSNYFSTVRVLGNSNSTWAYSSSGNASTAYDGDATPVGFNATTGYGTITITGIPSANNVRIRITLLNDNAAERWVIDDFKVTGTASASTAFYSASTGNLEILSNWGTNTDGTGTAPTSFTAASQTFNVRNRSTATIGATWTVSGSGSKIVVGDGTNACNFTIPSTFAVTGTVDVSAGAKLTNQNTANPTLGTLSSTSTVDYNGTGAQTVLAATYGNLAISGARAGTPAITLASGTVAVAGNFSVTQTGAVTYTTTGNTVDFSSASAQTIPAINYLNITNTGNGARTLASSGTIGVAGTFTTGAGAYTTTESTVNFNGSSAQSIPVLSYNNLTYSGSNTGTLGTTSGTFTLNSGMLAVSSGTLVLNSSNSVASTISVGSVNVSGGTLNGSNSTLSGLSITLKISGNWNQTAGIATVSGSGSGLLQFNGGGSSTFAGLSAFTGNLWWRLQVSNNTTLTPSTDILTDFNPQTTTTILTVDAGSTVNMGTNLFKVNQINNIFSVSGTLKTANLNGFSGSTTTTIVSTNTPTITLNSGSTIDYAATTGTQTVTGRADYANLTISGGSAKTLGSATTLSGTLTLTSGILTTTTTNTLTLSTTATTAISGGSTTAFVNGPLNWTLPASLSDSASIYSFPVGSGSTYLPLSLTTLSTGASGPVLQVSTTAGNASGTADGTTVTSLSNTEYWTQRVVSGNYTSGSLSLTRQTAVSPNTLIAKSATLAGSYSSIGGTASGNSINGSSSTGAITANNSQFYVLGTLAGLSTPPTLAPVVGATVDAPFAITFTDDATWRGAITSVTVGGSTLSPTAYNTTIADQITFTPSASTLLQSAGSKSIVVTATGYNTATVSQTIGAGAFTKLQTLLPGETAAPATGTGKTGTPTAVISGTALSATVNAVDQFWNVAASTDTIAMANFVSKCEIM